MRRDVMTEYLRPWKLITLGLGLNAIIVGSIMEHLQQRAIVASVVLALLAYLTAPWGVRVVIERRWRWMPLAAVYAWLCIVVGFFMWNGPRLGPEFEDVYRQTNLWQTTRLYLFCGFFWLYRGSMADLKADLRALRRD